MLDAARYPARLLAETVPADVLRADLAACDAHAWAPHKGQPGWSTLPLRNSTGDMGDNEPAVDVAGPWTDTPLMAACPAFARALAAVPLVLTSVRVSVVHPGKSIRQHADINPTRIRVHIPVLTSELVEFVIDGQRVAMRPGEAWIADFSKNHAVHNRGRERRVHLVAVVDPGGKVGA